MPNDQSATTLTIIGAVAAALTGGGGLWLTARKSSDDAMSSIVNGAIALNGEYRQRLDEQDEKIAQLTILVQHCEAEHGKARAALAAAGIPY